MKRLVAVALCAIALAGCQEPPVVWTKPGGSEQAFNTDRFQCMQASQQQSSSIFIDKYGGYGSSGQTTNMPLFAACMNARGYSAQNKSDYERRMGGADVIAARKEQGMRVAQSLCTNPKYAAYYAKTACTAPQISFDQLTDTTKISPEIKAIFLDLRRDVDAAVDESLSLDRKSSAAGAKRADLYLNVYKPFNDQNNLDLFDGKITWGEYNKRRQQINRDYEVAAAAIKA